MKTAAEISLKRTYRRKVIRDGGSEIKEPPWRNDEIRRAIKEREQFHISKRKETGEERERLHICY